MPSRVANHKAAAIDSLDDQDRARLLNLASVLASAPDDAIRVVGDLGRHLSQMLREREADDGLCPFGCGGARHETHLLPQCPAYQAEVAPTKRWVQEMIQREATVDRDALAATIAAKITGANAPRVVNDVELSDEVREQGVFARTSRISGHKPA